MRPASRPERSEGPALRIAALLTLCVALLVHPTIAWAHARLKKSAPAANAVLTTSPTAIRLWFTEAPELALTRVRLTDSTGADHSLGAPVQDVDGRLSVRLPVIETLGAGLYKVEWTTAAVDGHPSSGHFSFRVTGSVAAPAPASAPEAAPDVNILDSVVVVFSPTAAVARAGSFAALLALIGAVTFCVAVLPRVRGFDPAVIMRLERSVASGGAVAAVVYVVAAAARLYLQRRMMMDRGISVEVMSATHWVAMWRLQVAFATAACIGLLPARRRVPVALSIAAAACVALAAFTASSGHAGATNELYALSVTADTIHVVAAAGWMGSLLWLTVVGLPLVRASGEGRANHVAALVNAFSPVALGFAAVVALTGLVSAWLRLGEIPALWNSLYGQVLIAKLAALALLAAVGFHNWRRVRPTLGTDEATARLQRSAKLELAVGLLIVIVTAILVATPTPMPK